MRNIFTFLIKSYPSKARILTLLGLLLLSGGFNPSNGQGINNSGNLVDALGWNLSGYHILYVNLSPTDGDQSGKIDGVFTLSKAPIVAWGDYSIAVRFSNWGSKTAVIDCRNGGAFAAVNEIPFEFGKKYDCWVETAVYDKKYSVYIKAEGMEKPVLVADQYAYRIADLTELAVWSSLYNPSENKNELVVSGLKLVNTVGEIPGTDVADLNTGTKISAFPNPSNHLFTLEANGRFAYVVYNIVGTVVSKGEGINSCRLGAEWSKGVYMIEVSRQGKSQTLRLVKS